MFYIDKSVKDELSIREMTESELLFFSDMASAYQHGYCYLCGDIESLDYLSEHLGKPFNSIYNLVKNRYAENGEVIRIVSKVCVLTFQEELSLNMLPEILQKKDKSIFISIQLVITQNIKLNRPCSLIGENLTDCKFYKIVAKHYFYKHNIEKLNLNFHLENGGGDPTCEVLKKVIESDKTLTLCIVDSDRSYGLSKEYPNKPHDGNTLKHVRDVSKSLPKLPPHEVYPLHVHEIENLIPFKILQQIMEEQLPDMEAGLKFLKELQEINDGEPVLYYDFKNGFPYMKEKAKQAYWKNILLKLGKDNLKMPPETKKEAEQEAKQDNQLVTFPSLSRNKLLEKANGILKIKSISEKENMQKSIDGYLDTYWDEIGLLMLTWGCANLPVYA